MHLLLQREIDEMRVSGTRKESLVMLAATSITMILLCWISGPRMLDLVGVNGLTNLIVIAALVHAGSAVNFLLVEDSGHRQMTFLQILPVPATSIVKVRFLHIFLFWTKIFIWMGVVVSIHLLLNEGWSFTLLSTCVLASAVLLIWLSEDLLRYYFTGFGKWSNAIYVASLFFWILVYLSGDFGINAGSLNEKVASLGMLGLSIAIYFICWRLCVWRVCKYGFPVEVEDTSLQEIEKRAQDLHDLTD